MEKKQKEEKKVEGEEVVLTEKDKKEVLVVEKIIDNRELAHADAFGKLNRGQIELIKRTYAKGATDDELNLFITVCHGLQLSPFSKQVYLVPRWDSKTGKEVKQIQVGIDGFRATAEKTGKYAGNDDPIFEGEREIVLVNEKTKTKSSILVPNKATITVWKVVEGLKCGFTASARWEEYYPGAKNGFQWHSKPYLMLGKCAEALALRKGFPALLSGIYTPEELDSGKSEMDGQEKQESALKVVKQVINKASAMELAELKTRIDGSLKYTPEQKSEISRLIAIRLVELEPKEKDVQA